MKKARFQLRYLITAALISGLAVVAACGGSEKSQKGPLVEDELPNPPFLADIPADTPYAIASLEALPIGPVIDQMQGMVNSYGKLVETLEKDLAERPSPQGKQALEMMKLTQRMLTREGMTEIGMSLNPRIAAYGIGFYPVLRFELADPERFKNFADKFANVSGMPLQSAKRGEMEYQYVRDGDSRILVSYRGTEIHVGISQASADSLYLPYYFGEKKPANPISKANAFEEIKEKYGFLGFAVGFVDFERVAEAIVDPAPGLNGETWVMASDSQPRSFSPECQREIKAIAANFPRIVGGYTQFDEKAMGFRAGLETRTSLGTDLAAAKSPIPAHGNPALGEAIFQAGAGISVQKLMQTVQAHAASIRETPYQCQDLAMLNQWAQQSAQIGMMIPPALSQLRGLHLAATNLNMDVPEEGLDEGSERSAEEAPESKEGQNAEVEEEKDAATAERPKDDAATTTPDAMGGMPASPGISIEGFAFISTSAPEQLIEGLALMVPELRQLQMKPDGTPRALPPIRGTEMLLEPYAVMTQNGIAISSGKGAETVAADALAAAPSGDSPMLMMRYNLSGLKSFVDQMPTEEASLLEPFFSQGPTTIAVDPEDRGIFMEMKYRWVETD